MSRVVLSHRITGAACLSLLVFMAALVPTVGAEASDCDQGPVLSLRLRVTDDDEVAEVRIDGQPVIRVHAPLGGMRPSERGRMILTRLRGIGHDEDMILEVEPGMVSGYHTVMAGSTVLVTVDASTADENRTTPAKLAERWCNRIREAFGAPMLRDEAAAAVAMVASWYGEKFEGRPTASGEPFDPDDLTAAHRLLPFGTLVQVTYPRTGRTVTVRVNDRGPFTPGRDLDLSRAAADRLGLLPHGVDEVVVSVIEDE